jgi:NitT/TauT family transport system substrate-binding protein
MPGVRRLLRRLTALLSLLLLISPALAEEPVRIGSGFGLAFLPGYICEDLKLVEKYGKTAHLALQPSYQRFLGAGPLQDALGTDAIDLAPFGTAPLLAAWEKAKNTPRQIFAVSGLTTLPPVLLTNRAEVHTLADFRSADRIAVPSASAPQLYLLQMQSEKVLANTTSCAAKSSSSRIRTPSPICSPPKIRWPVIFLRRRSPRSRSPTGACTRC